MANGFKADLDTALAGFVCAAHQFVSRALLTRMSLHDRAARPIVLEATRLGITAGRGQKTLLFMIDWDAYYNWPLDTPAAHLGIERGCGDDWDYTKTMRTGRSMT